MKKTLLLSAALLAMGFASAQTVQDINTNPLKLGGEYSKCVAVYPRVPATADEVLPDPSIGENRYAWEQQQQHVEQTADFWEGDYMDLKINNTKESQYILHFQYAVKTDGASITFELRNGDDVEQTRDVPLANEKSNWHALYDAMAFFDEELPEGEYTLRVVFHHENTKETANLANFWFEAKEQITYFSLYTSVYPEGAGTVKVSPAANSYLEGTTITLTATPSAGDDETTYKFVNFTNEESEEVFTANPWSFEIFDMMSVVANFEVMNSVNPIPGYINFDTRKISGGEIQNSGIKTVKLDGSTYMDGATNVDYLGNYRKGKSEQFILNATKAGEYTVNIAAGCKEDKNNAINVEIFDKAAYDADPTVAPEASFDVVPGNTGQWTNFETNTHKATLTEGKKILNMKFTSDDKYGVNVLFIAFGIGDDFGNTSAIEGIEVEDADAPVKAYNLQGIPVDPATAKGLLIINGKKVIK